MSNPLFRSLDPRKAATPVRTLRALSWLLGYPDAAMSEQLPALRDVLAQEGCLKDARLKGLTRLIDSLIAMDPYDVQAEYVELFDRGRSTALHLFEHVHGDSRDRGQAMVDLIQTYEQGGMLLRPDLAGQELPDYLPLVLEFVSTLPAEQANGFVGEFSHILNVLYAALLKRRSLYAHIPAALLELCGHAIEATEVPEDEALDEAWAEPAAFDGCSTRGQQRADQPQPIHIVRKSQAPAKRGASS